MLPERIPNPNICEARIISNASKLRSEAPSVIRISLLRSLFSSMKIREGRLIIAIAKTERTPKKTGISLVLALLPPLANHSKDSATVSGTENLRFLRSFLPRNSGCILLLVMLKATK